jgi:S1-C subfamily serine protease
VYKSRLLAASEGRQIWGIDADEIAWAAANLPQILDRDLQVVPYAGGGLRVDAVAPDSIGAARGLLAGDVLREVDGRPVWGVSDLRPLPDNPNTKTPQSLRLTIERAGKPLLLEYRPLPR